MDPSVVEVYRAANGAQARMFVMALEQEGIKAEIQGELFHPAGQSAVNLMGSSAATWWDAPRILVQLKDADRAKRLLLYLEEGEPNTGSAAAGMPDLEVECEECGETALFPEAQRGSVQNCPHCFAHIDVEEAERDDDDADDEDADDEDADDEDADETDNDDEDDDDEQ